MRVQGCDLIALVKPFYLAGIRLHAEAFLHGIEVMLDGPKVIRNDAGPIYFVFVLDNAAYIDLRHGECLSQNLYAARLNDRFLKRFAGKFRDPAVRLQTI